MNCLFLPLSPLPPFHICSSLSSSFSIFRFSSHRCRIQIGEEKSFTGICLLNQPHSPLFFFSLEKTPAVCLLLAHMQNWIFRAQAAATFEVLIKHNIYLRKRSSSLGFQISEVWKLIPCCSSPLSFPPLFKHKANFGDGKTECSIFYSRLVTARETEIENIGGKPKKRKRKKSRSHPLPNTIRYSVCLP